MRPAHLAQAGGQLGELGGLGPLLLAHPRRLRPRLSTEFLRRRGHLGGLSQLVVCDLNAVQGGRQRENLVGVRKGSLAGQAGLLDQRVRVKELDALLQPHRVDQLRRHLPRVHEMQEIAEDVRLDVGGFQADTLAERDERKVRQWMSVRDSSDSVKPEGKTRRALTEANETRPISHVLL